jgi:hypothetical protein
MAEIELGILIKLLRQGNGAQIAAADLKRVAQAAEQLDAEFEQLATDIDVANARLKANQTTTNVLTEKYLSLAVAGETSRAEFRQLAAEIGDAQAAEKRNLATTSSLVEEYNQLATSTGRVDAAMIAMAWQLDDSEQAIDRNIATNQRLQTELQQTATRAGHVADEFAGLGDRATTADAPVSRLTTQLSTLSTASKRAATGLSNIGIGIATALSNKAVGYLEDAARATVRFSQDSVKAFTEYDLGLRQSLTLLDEFTAQSYGNLDLQVTQLDALLRRTSTETLPAYYKALSLQSDDPESDIALASKAARAGVGELTGTLEAGLSVANAYGNEVYDLAQIYDLFFTAIDDGNITMSNLEGGISRVTSVSGELGVGLADALSMLVIMTNQGDDFNEAVDLTATLLTQLGVAGTAQSKAFQTAANTTFREFIAEGNSVADAMLLLENYTKENDIDFASFFAGDSKFHRDQLALQAGFEITGKNMQAFIDQTERMNTDAAGNLDIAASRMAGSMAGTAKEAEVAAERFSIAWGKFLAPGATALYGSGANFLNRLSGAADTAIFPALQEQLAQVETLAQLVPALQQMQDFGFFNPNAGFGADIDDRIAAAEQIHQIILSTSSNFTEYNRLIQSLPRNVLYTLGLSDDFRVIQSEGYFNQLLADLQAQQELILNATVLAQNIANYERQYGTKGGSRPDDSDFDFRLLKQREPEALAPFFDDSDFDMAALKADHAADAAARAEAASAAAAEAAALAAAEAQRLETVGFIEAFVDVKDLATRQVAAQATGDAAEITAASDEITTAMQRISLQAGLSAALAEGDATGFDALITAAVGIGTMTQEQADAQRELAQTKILYEELGEAVVNLDITPDERITIEALIADGTVTSFQGAVDELIGIYTQLSQATTITPIDTTGLTAAETKIAGLFDEEEQFALNFQIVEAGERQQQLQNLLSLTGDLDASDPTIDVEHNADTVITAFDTLNAYTFDSKTIDVYYNYPDGTPDAPGGGYRRPPDSNAMGTAYFQGGLTWVGEQGRELVALPQGSRIWSNRESEAIAGGSVTQNITLQVVDEPTARLAQAVIMDNAANALRTRLRAPRGTT